MRWTHLKIGDPESGYDYWISGIYKVVKYTSAAGFYAFYIPPRYANWGTHVNPTADKAGGNIGAWSSLDRAKKACEKHAEKHVPSNEIVKRAAEILEQYKQEDYIHVLDS